MPPVYELKYRDGRVENLFGHRGYYYVLGKDTLMSFMPIPAWCRHCKEVTLAEPLMKPDEIDAELKEIENPGSAWHRNHKRPWSAEEISRWQNHLKNQLNLWKTRTSLPRCMHCGKDSVGFFVEGKWAPHPGTGDEVLFTLVGIGSTNFADRFFDPDGAEIALTEAQREHYYSLKRDGKVPLM